MKITFVTAWVSRRGGGLFSSVRGLAQSLIRDVEGIRLLVLGLSDRYTTEDLPEWGEVRVCTAVPLVPRAFGYSPRLAKELTSEDPDLVHLHGLWMYPSVVSESWTRRRRKPRVVSPRGMLDPWALRNSAWKKRLALRLYETSNLRGAACIHALCKSEVESIRAFGLRNPVCLVPNGVELPDDGPLSDPPWAAQVPPKAKVLLYLGRLHPKKGLPNLIRAWAAIPKAIRSDWYLVIAGWDQGGHEAELKRLSSDIVRDGTLLFVGPQFGVGKRSALANAEAFVLPSYSEGLPVAVLEAWAHSRPVVITTECNIPEGFEAGAAIQVEAEAASIAHGLTALFTMTDAERREMGWRGRRLVDQRFSWKQVARQMKQVYQWLLGGGAKPGCVVD